MEPRGGMFALAFLTRSSSSSVESRTPLGNVAGSIKPNFCSGSSVERTLFECRRENIRLKECKRKNGRSVFNSMEVMIGYGRHIRPSMGQDYFCSPGVLIQEGSKAS